MIGEQNSDQSLHLKMETDNHNHRYKSYRGTRCSVTMATLGGWGWGGHHHQLSEIGCWCYGAMVQLSWLFCPLTGTDSGSFYLDLVDNQQIPNGQMGKAV